jgi:hypothetical protein
MIITGQGTAGTSATLLVNIPPGPSATILVGGGVTAYYGGTGVSTTNGAALPGGAIVSIPGFATSKGGPLYLAATASTIVSYTVSTDS